MTPKSNKAIYHLHFVMIILLANFAFAQTKVDTLIRDFNVQTNTVKKIDLCIQISDEFSANSNNINKSLNYINIGLQLNGKLSNDTLLPQLFIRKANSFLIKNGTTINDSSTKYFNEAQKLEKYMSVRTKKRYYLMRGLYLALKSPGEGLAELLKAKKIAQLTNGDLVQVDLQIAQVYYLMENYTQSNAILLSIPESPLKNKFRNNITFQLVNNYLNLKSDSCLFYAKLIPAGDIRFHFLANLVSANYLIEAKQQYNEASMILNGLKKEYIFNSDTAITNQIATNYKLNVFQLSAYIKSKKAETERNVSFKNVFLNEAIDEYKNILKLYDSPGNKDIITYTNICKVQTQIYSCYKNLNNLDSAIHYLEKSFVTDSLVKSIKNNESARNLMAKYDVEKKEIQIELLSQQNKLSESENSKQKLIIVGSLLIAALFFCGFLIFVNRNKVKRKANAILSLQKQKIVEANIELNTQKQHIEFTNTELNRRNNHIQDSMDYASVIQKSILTNEETIREVVKNYFLIYQPKEAVGGDFYWFYKSPGNHSYYIALVDCTGHGVPGSLMTLLCSSIFNQVVEQYPNIMPAELLNNVNKRLYKSFNKDNVEKRTIEGMDLTLLHLDYVTNILSYAGARNSIILINGKEEVTELTVDRYTVGREPEYAFEQKEILLHPNDTLYLFTDGYVDQKGGPKNFKLLKTNFIKELQRMQSQDMKHQKEHLENYFTLWKGENEQIDDVSVIGIRI
jgi:serine phosphatase RsbU (regulator of sigma subunit)